MAERPAYPGLRRNGSSPPAEVALVVNNTLSGRLNSVIDVAIPLNASAVIAYDERIHVYSMILAEPGSTIMARVIEPGQVTLSVTPGAARVERIVVLG